MHHEAFSLHPLLPPDLLGSEQVSAVLLHADRVLVGTEKGALLVFDLSHPSTSDAPPSATLVSRHEGFSKKAIDQLGAIKELNALVSLSGGDVSLHSFSDLALLSSFAPQTKSTCSLFTLSTSLVPPPPSPSGGPTSALPQLHTSLALACRRRLLLLSWTDGAWDPLVELGLPHQIRGMSFVDDGTRLVAGFSTGEYGIVSVDRGADKPKAELGELFSAPFPVATAESAAAASGNGGAAPTGKGSLRGAASSLTGGLGALGGLAGLGALPGALGKKVEKNGVVGVPRRGVAERGKGKGVRRNGGDEEDDAEERTGWMWGKEWGWEDEEDGGKAKEEVLVVRDHLALPLTSDGKPRSSPHPPTLTYPAVVDETVVLSPFVLSLVAPPAPPPPGHAPLSPAQAGYSLVVHDIEALTPLQTLPVPPQPVSPPSSIAESTSSAFASSIHASPSKASAKPSPPTSTARLLTAPAFSPSSSSGASSCQSASPALILTSAPATGSIATGGGFPTQTLWLVRPSPWSAQIPALGRQSGSWDFALSLLRRSPAPRAAARALPAPLVRDLATLHALSLFRRHCYSEAVDAFIRLEVSPAKVVALYEEAISGKVRVGEEGWEGLFGGRTEVDVRAQRDREAREKEDEERGKCEAEERDRVLSAHGSGSAAGSPARGRKGPLAAVDDDDAASIRSLGSGIGGRLVGKKSWLREGGGGEEREREEREAAAQARKEAAALDAQHRRTSVDELIRYLTDRRQKYSLALSSLLPSQRPAPSDPRPTAPAPELLALPNVPLTDLEPGQLARAAQVVDTALFRAYLATRPIMVGPLCRIENWCEVEEVEGLLMGAKKYRELLDLYNGKNMHDKAVKLLQQMTEADDEDDPAEKFGPMVRYLQKLGPEHVEVIYEASRWVFERDTEAGLQIFTADLEEVESLPRHSTMAHLEKIGREVCIRYLEHVVHQLGEQGAEFHEKLIELYLAELVERRKKGEAITSSPLYAKLLAFLSSSTSYRADRMLGRLPSASSTGEDMHEVRAVLLGRLGRHEGALQIYVYQLGDHKTAEQYCKRVYDDDETMRPTIFPLLLRLYLRPRPGQPLLFDPALSLLATHAARIPHLEAFDLLPPLVAVKDLQTYLEKTLRRSGERRREGTMVREVQRAWMEEKEWEKVTLEERRVKVSEGRVCPVCAKRIGNSVIAIHNPHGEVTHYQCREQFKEMRAQ
ncbi:hypothetical protein JCM8097_002743 [Rhodosporidiobolus ruineniae]